MTSGAPDTAGLRWLEEASRRALEASGTDCYRWAEGPGLRVERYGPALLVSSAGAGHPVGLAPEILERTRDVLPCAPVFSRLLVRGPRADDRPVRLTGEGDVRCVAQEGGLGYEVDFSAGYSCGLFLDQRANRARLRALAPARTLNLFAFTCSFSVCAAAAGGVTTSVDLARAAIERGRRNFQLNALDAAGHRFYVDDAFAILPRLARRGERFDAIVLDPPTFSRGHRGRVFRVARDFGALLGLALACAAPGAHVLASTNASDTGGRALAAMIRRACPRARDLAPGAPLPDIPDGAATLWFRVP